MKRLFFSSVLLSLLINSYSQEQPALKLTPSQFEALFLQQNLQLIAEKMNVDIADAAILQAKLWDNPEITISSVNLWSTENQRDGEKEMIPPLFGSFARNTQFTVELSQLIQTANKRAKLVRMEQVAKDITIQVFEDVLRGLKVELRKTIYEAIHIQSYLKILQLQTESLERLINTYRRLVLEGNMARSELLRLQSSLLEVENEMNESLVLQNEFQKTLKTLINVDPFSIIAFEIDSDYVALPAPKDFSLPNLLNRSLDNRPDIKIQQLTTRYYEKSVAYEKSLRVPDLTFNANYDRYGGVWKDYLGAGFSVGIPVWNRNQGNIKASRFLSEQSRYLEEQQIKLAQNEIIEAYENYRQAHLFFTKIKNDDFLSEMDKMLDAYEKNLINKNLSMLEFIDFMSTFRTNKQLELESEKKVRLTHEELLYRTGIMNYEL